MLGLRMIGGLKLLAALVAGAVSAGVLAWGQTRQAATGDDAATGPSDAAPAGTVRRTAEPAAVPALRHEYRGLTSCARCHDQPLDRRSRDHRDLCFLNEFLFFERSRPDANATQVARLDKHLLAYRLLEGPIGQSMAERLAPFGYDVVRDADGWRWNDKRCLSCHANWHWREGHPKPPSFQDGVSCESCHGPSADWEREHDRIEWRTKSIEEKESLGFVDVRNPVKRARQCFSCHIGNPQQGKVVTHEMYAAGHPPLPGVEIETFAGAMPAHWRSLPEKAQFLHRDAFLARTRQDDRDHALTDLPRTKSVVIGGVMALRETLNLVAQRAADDEMNWPELSAFDCQACHHDLQTPAWRLARGYSGGVPGRPHVSSWPTALVPLALRHLAKTDEARLQHLNGEFHIHLDQLRRVLDEQPYGDRKAIGRAVDGEQGLIAWLDRLAEELLRSRFDRADAQFALKSLIDLDPSAYPDCHSARQIAWAARIIAGELALEYPQYESRADFPPEDLTLHLSQDQRDIQVYLEWLKNEKQPAEQRVNALFTEAGLNQLLRLELPAGQEHSIGQSLPESLKAVAEYDPHEFRRRLRALADRLPER